MMYGVEMLISASCIASAFLASIDISIPGEINDFSHII